MNKNRILILDGFRGLAILIVILFHFFTRWAIPFNSENLYPFQNNFNFFPNGALGVKLFFMISGFVIFMTLEKTASFKNFILNRIIRLFPTMLIVSFVTLLFFLLVGPNFIFYFVNTNLTNFFTSIFFLSPSLLKLFQIDSNYLNGSYWSLWPEIQFYIFLAIMYYFSTRNKFETIIFISILLILFNYIFNRTNLPFSISNTFNKLLVLIFGVFNLLQYLQHFIVGVIWYYIYANKYSVKKWFFNSFLFFVVCFQIYSGVSLQLQLFTIGFNLLFFLLCFKPIFLNFFSNKFIQMVGIGSYALYLFHEQVGVSIINKISGDIPLFIQGFLVLLLILLMIFLSYLYTQLLEKKIISWLKLNIIKVSS